MTNRMTSLLERAARVRKTIETRSMSMETTALQLLRLKRLSLIIDRHLERCLSAAFQNRQTMALVPVPARGRDRRF